MDTMVGLINLTFSFKGRRENMVNRGKCWVKIVELFLWLFQYSRFGSVCGLREECRKGAFRRENPSASKRRKDVAFLLGAGKKRLEVMVDQWFSARWYQPFGIHFGNLYCSACL